MLKKRWILLFVLVLALTLSACSGNSRNNSNDQISKGDNTDTDTNNGANSDYSINNTNTTTKVSNKDIKLTPAEAFNIYVKKHPNVTVDKLALDYDRGSYVYEVEGYKDKNKYELKINPLDGKILKEEQEKRDANDTGKITMENVNKIQELIDKALKDSGNSYKVNEWELKSENGQSIFEIDIVDGNNHDIDYKYNINTMELIEKDQ